MSRGSRNMWGDETCTWEGLQYSGGEWRGDGGMVNWAVWYDLPGLWIACGTSHT
jgi:hypothetical protein